MNDLNAKIIETYGNRLRIRVCGVCFENDALLVVNHSSLQGNNDFWSPPGGGMEFGMSAEDNLKREMEEETGLLVEIERFMWVHEYLAPPLHAIELFFEVSRTGGSLKVGYDPEMSEKEQIIKEVRFMPLAMLKILPENQRHQALSRLWAPVDHTGPDAYDIFRK